MRTPCLFLLLLACLAGCDLLGDGLAGGRSRTDCGPHDPGAPGRGHPADSSARPPAAAPDTSLLFTAVRFPADYDWQRDSAYGSAAFELQLYRDFEPVLTLASGPDVCFSPDPDRHHILSGHLYTERMADGTTRIGRDGTELFRFPGREYLVGLFEDGEDLYTLSRAARGQGFSYRKNGEILLRRSDGAPYGDLADPSYGPTGALYRDEGKICFCFHAGSSSDRTFYLVRDAVETRLDTLLPSANILDIKLHRGHAFVLHASFLKNLLREGRIWPANGSYAISGRFWDGGGGYYSGFAPAGHWSAPQRLCREEAAVYYSPEASYAVSTDASGTVRWWGIDGMAGEIRASHFFSPACAALLGGRFVMALTPRDITEHPRILQDGREREITLHGYVSSVSLAVSPPAN